MMGSLLTALLLLGAVPTVWAEATPTKRIHRPVFAPELAGRYLYSHRYPDGSGQQVFDKLEFEAAEKLVELHWYGVYSNGFGRPGPEIIDPGEPDTDIWQITFQSDFNGKPGAFLHSFSVPASEVTRTQIDHSIFIGPHPRYSFSHTFATPPGFQANTPFWISVLSVSNSEGGVFTQSSGSAGAITATSDAELVAADLRDAPRSRGVNLPDQSAGTAPGARALTLLTIPLNDADEDGMDDAWEARNGLATDRDDSGGDPDEDGLTNLREFERRTDPQNADSDGDGLNDLVESGTGLYLDESDRGTSPNHVDSDGDGLNDKLEVPSQPTLGTEQPGTHPLMPDTDRDGLRDDEEILLGTNPKHHDSDGDSISDNWEILHGSNPNDPASPVRVTHAPLGAPSSTWQTLQELPSFNGFRNDADERNATFSVNIDFEAKPDGEPELIFETGGGGVGYSLVYEAGNRLVLRAIGDSGRSLAFIEGVLREEWIEEGELEVVWSYEVSNSEGSNTMSLWVDGHPISEIRKDLGGDWSGARPASFGVGGTARLGTGVGGVGDTAADFTSGTINLTQGLRYFEQVPAITSIELPSLTIRKVRFNEAGLLELEWSSHPQAIYSVERSYDLQHWEEVDDSIDSDGFTTTWSVPHGSGPRPDRAYYRVIENP
jgi:hypothetical protein